MRVIACGGRKLPHAAPARELYLGAVYQQAKRWAEQAPDGNWFILSAAHGLVHPDTVLEPYDLYITKDKRYLEWAVKQLGQAIPPTVPPHLNHPGTVATVAAPLRYFLALQRYSNMTVQWAFEGLPSTRMGYQRQWLKANTKGAA